MSGDRDIRGLGTRTKAVHAGESPNPVTRASAPDIAMSATFVVDEPAGFSAYDLTPDSPFLYGRWANPTVRMLEEKLAALEETQAAACFASGMAAASAIFASTLKAGDHAVIGDTTYAGVAELARDILPGQGIEVSLVNSADPDAVAAAMTPKTRLVYAETPANPLMRLTDIAALGRIAHEGGAKLAIDSTFATPIATKPARLGADYVAHSLTKYIGGHGDAIGGAVAGASDDIMAMVRGASVHHGGVLSPFNAWLINRGAATLPLRMAAHEAGALAVARFLEDHPKVARVVYPGLASHPQAELARAQMANFSGMLSFQPKGDGGEIARRMTEELSIIHYAVSLGHHRSLVFWMPTADLMASSFRLSGPAEAAYRDFAGDGIFRLSIGLEDPDDLCADLDRALG